MVFSSLVITPVNAENSGTQTVSETLVYSENFEEWATDNLLSKATAIDGKTGYYTATAAEGKTVNMYSAKAYNASVASMVGAVDATTEGVSDADHSGKVLKYVNNDGANDFIIVRLGSDASADLDGKITVLEYDMYLPSGTDKSIPETGLPSLSADKDRYDTHTRTVNALLINNSAKFSGGGSFSWTQRDNPAKFAVYNALNSGFDMGSWHKIKVVYTNGKAPSKDAPDTWRVYCDGNLVQGKLLANSGKTVVTEDVYDYLPRSYQYGPGPNQAADATDDSKNSFRDMSFQNEFLGLEFGTKGSATGTAKAIYYDNISIKTIDKTFDIDNIECNKTSFNAESDTIKVSFTTPVDETKLTEVQINDESGNVVNNAIKSIAVDSSDATKLTIALDPNVLGAGSKYSLIFPATFTDVYGQGLVRYYSATRSADAAKNTNFYSADIPKSSSLTACEFRTEYKMKTVYSENFEEWTTDNLLSKATAIDGKTGYYTATAAEGKTVNMYSAKAYNASVASMVGAVDATTEGVSDADHSGKVLKYVNNDGANDFIIVRLGSDASADLDGKITVLEYDMYLPSGTDKSIPETGLPSLSADKDRYDTHTRTVNALLINNSAKFSGGGSFSWTQRDNPAKFAVYNALNSGFDMGSWHKIKVVYTNGKAPSKDAPDTWRVYCDGNLVQGKLLANSGKTVVTEDVYDYLPRSYQYGPGPNQAADATDDSKNSFRDMSFQNEFLGLEFGTKGSATGTAKAIYYDNISIKTIDKTFDIDNIECNKTSFNAESDTIKVSFTTPVDETKLTEVQINDESGKAVNNAIKSIMLDMNDATKLTIALDSNVLELGGKYSLVFPATFTDVYGQGLLRYYSAARSADDAKGTQFYNADIPKSSSLTALTFATAKSKELNVADIKNQYDFAKGNYSETLSFYNITSNELPVWVVVAAYDAEGAMLCSNMIDKFTVSGNGNVEKDIEFIVDESLRKSVTSVKLFIWDTSSNMKPYMNWIPLYIAE